jgi:arginine/lysine/ornithine decarboxylase
VVPDAAAWAGEQAFSADPGMNNGVDDRHQSCQVEPTAMQLFAQAVGADQTLFSTNGSNGFGQTSVLSLQGERIDASRLEMVFELEQSTSASALLLSSIDAARRQFQRDGEQLAAAGVMVEGATDESLEQFRVVAA